MGISELKTVLSAVFIILGALVFYISSLVSGHNIYRDLTFKLAMMVTTLIGLIIFVFSPICFVVLFPSLFDLDASSEIIKVRTIHKLILENLLVDYVLMAVGLGLLFGCLSAISARSIFLHWIREKTGLKFPIFTYGQTWDHLLMRVKSHGRIILETERSTVEGQLVVHSVNEEPKQIILKNYTISSNDEPFGRKYSGQLLITEFNNIKEIQVPSSSFNLHKDLIPHTTQSFYTALAAFGVLLVSTSLWLTSDFLRKSNFGTLSTTYASLTLIFLTLAVVLIVVSCFFYRKDFNKWTTAAVLFPYTLVIILLEASYLIIMMKLVFGGVFFSHQMLIRHLFPYIIAALFPLAQNWSIINKLRVIFRSVSTPILNNLLDEIYISIDLNSINSRRWLLSILEGKDEAIDDLIQKIDKPVEVNKEVIRRSFRQLRELIFSYSLLSFCKGFLLGDEHNVLLLFHAYVARNEKEMMRKEMALCRTHSKTTS